MKGPLITLMIVAQCVAQVDTSKVLSYFPLHVGNEWHWSSGSISRITGDTLINGVTYYLQDGAIPWRVDTLSLNVLMWDSNYDTDTLVLDLTTTESWAEYSPHWFFIEEYESSVFDSTRTIREYEYSWTPLYEITYKYASGLGQIYERMRRHNSDGYSRSLRGCIVDGVGHGTLLEIMNPASSLSHQLNIRSYPNPGNPETKIEYRVIDRSSHSIQVHSIDGRRIGRKQFSNLDPGIHYIGLGDVVDIETLESGIYILSISANDFKDTDKLLLLK